MAVTWQMREEDEGPEHESDDKPSHQ